MLRVRLKMRSGASTTSPQSITVAKEAGVTRMFRPPVEYQRSAVLSAVCVQPDLSRRLVR
jgi:hypothetical protein